MGKNIKNITLAAMNYLSVVPLFFFLFFTNQDKEMEKLIKLLKE